MQDDLLLLCLLILSWNFYHRLSSCIESSHK